MTSAKLLLQKVMKTVGGVNQWALTLLDVRGVDEGVTEDGVTEDGVTDDLVDNNGVVAEEEVNKEPTDGEFPGVGGNDGNGSDDETTVVLFLQSVADPSL